MPYFKDNDDCGNEEPHSHEGEVSWEELMRQQKQTRDVLKEQGIPHVEVSVFNDHSDETPLSHTAYSFESLINTLLAIYTSTSDAKFVALLQYISMALDNINALTADLIIQRLREQHGESNVDKMLNYMKKFNQYTNSSDKTNIPDAFMDAFKEEDDDESR